MNTIHNIEAYEELAYFIEENLSKLIKLKLITRKKYEQLDQLISDYLIADNFGDNERKEMYADELEALYSEILDKTDKTLVADADPLVFELSKKLLACSEYEDYVPLLDKMNPEKDPEELLGDLTDVLLKMAEDMKGAPLTPEERDKLTQRITENKLHEEEKAYADSHYKYSYPDYAMYAKQNRLSKPISYLVPGFDDDKVDLSYEAIVAEVEGWPREKLVKNITKVIYKHLEEWHKGEDGEDAYMYGLRASLALIEHFHLHECLPAVMEILRQDYEFHDVYFLTDALEDMLPAVLAHIIEAEDLPLLMDFMKQPGLLFDSKRYVAKAVAHLPKLDKAMLQPVQQWLAEVLNYYFPLGTDTDVFDEMTLDTLVYCCIHCNAVDLKPLIIKLYAQYRIPNIWVGGGCNEMRQQIKKAPLGTLDEESGEELLIDDINAALEDEEDEDDEDWEDEDLGDEDWEDEAGDPDFNIEEYDWQEFSPYAMRPKAVYKPIRTIQKYTLRVSLDGTKPAVWRELVVPSNLTLLSMASVILLAMGWDEDHLHQFIVGKGRNATCYATSIGELESGMLNSKDGRKFCIGELLRKQGDVTLFEYDYGDSWYHSVQLVALEEYEQDEKKEVMLTAGERACPPEDCGGIPGYMDICEAMKHPDTAYAQERIEWMGCRFDPDLFPLKKAQAIVKKCNQKA